MMSKRYSKPMLKLLHRLGNFLARHDRLRVILDDQSGSVYLERYFLLFQGRKDGQNSSNIQEPPFNLLLVAVPVPVRSAQPSIALSLPPCGSAESLPAQGTT